MPFLINPEIVLYSCYFVFICLEFSVDTFYACLFYLWALSVMQGVLLLLHFGYELVQLGELPPRKIMLRNYRTRMKHIYFNLRR